MSLVPFLAWIGLGADGLSSSSYGPQEAYAVLANHTYIALLLAAATTLTVVVLSYTYAQVIEHFPHGGGGYVVASSMLGSRIGAVSGSALILDYVLTITVSIASCTDALFSYLPAEIHFFKVPFSCFLIAGMVVINIRGLKESITVLAPIFLFFILTHLLLFSNVLFSYGGHIPAAAHSLQAAMHQDLTTIGVAGILFIFLRSYSFGGGTYTGIEAVSNGMPNMREPKVKNGKITMAYIAISLSLTVAALFLCYVLLGIHPVAGKTLNAVLADTAFGNWSYGHFFAMATLLSEAGLLLAGAQTGFATGPQVMSNMAVDSWFPHSFAHLSLRLTMINGILLMGIASILLILYTGGSVSSLIVMFSINVFITFTITQLGMIRLNIRNRNRIQHWKWYLSTHAAGFILCITILLITTIEKFALGGWLTFLVTALLVAGSFSVHRRYRNVQAAIQKADDIISRISFPESRNDNPPDPKQKTAVLLVSHFNGLGVHTLESMSRNFPGLYKNVIFASVAVIDSGTFKGIDAINNLEETTRESLGRYMELARRMGFASEYRIVTSTNLVESIVDICKYYHLKFPDSTVFAGQLIFRRETFSNRILHNRTALAIQNRLLEEEITMIILPMRIQSGFRKRE